VGWKFLAIKLILALSTLQGFIINNIVPNAPDDATAVYNSNVRRTVWSNFILNIECLFLAVQIWKGFPAEVLLPPPPYPLRSQRRSSSMLSCRS
jgi:hypothetical protein